MIGVGLGVGVLDGVEGAVVEDRAVLVDLDERRAAVGGGGGEHLGQVLAVGVDGAGHERRLGAERQRDRVERVVHRAHRRGLGDLAGLGGGGVLALGEAVDPVVEQQDRHVDVAAQGVDEVVAADRQGVAVAGDDPHREVRAGGGDAGRDRRARGRGSSACRRCPGSRGNARSSRCRRRTRCSRGAGPGRAGTLDGLEHA